MRGDAVLGDLVHLGGSDLHFDPLALRPDHRRVQGPVIVPFRGRDVVLEQARHHRIGAVDNAERLITRGGIVDDDAERDHVGQLLERDVLQFHLAPDGKRSLLTAYHRCLDPGRRQRVFQLVRDPVNQAGARRAQEFQALQDGVAGFCVQHLERQVLQLVLDLVHADAFGKRRVDLHGLPRNALTLLPRS